MINSLDRLTYAPEPEAIAFAYSLDTHGWASLDLTISQRTFSVRDFGNTTDGLGDLVRAALNIATGDSYASLIFDCEPQRWGLAIEPAGLSSNNVRISRISMHDGGTSLNADGYSNRPVWRWDAVPAAFEGHVTTDAFALAVLEIGKQVRSQFDDATYRDRWGHYGCLEGFPLRGLHALEAALAVTEYRES
jgi:hypothetical protein